MMLGDCRKFLFIAVLAFGALAWGCGGSTPSNTITVQIAPTTPTVLVNSTVQFFASVTGSTDRTVTWTLNDKPASDTMSDVGKISVDGLYTAPSKVPNPVQTITVKATANADKKSNATTTITLDSGIRVTVIPPTATIGTGESFTFTASVTNDLNSNVTWSVKETNAGTIVKNAEGMGVYTAPATVPSPATATIVATSTTDSARTGSATVTIVTAQAATFSGISPTKAPQGGLFQDVYLNVTNLRSTSKIFFGTAQIDPSTQLVVISDKLARLRLLAKDLIAVGTVTISVEGATVSLPAGATDKITISPVRPAIVESFPESAPRTSTTSTLNVLGGYFGTMDSPLVISTDFNGQPRIFPNIEISPRSLTISLSPGDLATAGLYSFAVENKLNSALRATSNIAVQPATDPAITFATVAAADGANPSAIAIDTVAGIVIIANAGTNSVQLMNLKVTPLGFGSPITVGSAGATPIGVAVDEQRHIALVVNRGDKMVTRIDLLTGAITGTFDLKTAFGAGTVPTPAAIGVEPNSGLALVVYESTNTASIVKYVDSALQTCLFGTVTPCVVGGVTVSTGAKPQVAVDPRLRWAFVTPGGAGPLSILDLSQPPLATEIAVAPDGAKRASNVVTITTKTNHNLNPTVPTSVTITGVADTTFNGTFSVTSVPDAKTFTYNQTAANASSGGGLMQSGRPVVTFAIGNTIRGIAINPVAGRVLLADANANFADIISELDQSNISASLDHPANLAAFNPFSNVGVLVKSTGVGAGVDTLTLIDPSKPAVLKDIAIPAGQTGASGIAIDPGTNRAFIANATSNNVSVVSLGDIKSVHVSQLIIRDPARQLIPNFAFAGGDLPITITGNGFTGAPKVRLDGTDVATAVSTDDRQLNVTIPASFLAAPRRYSLDVINGGIVSNSMDFTVVQAVPIPAASAGCTGTVPRSAPAAVAIDYEREVVLVANSGEGCNSVSIVDLTTGTVLSNVPVGTRPEGVAVLPRAARAVVSNNGSNTASIIDLSDVTSPKIIDNGNVTTGNGPLGVAINQDTGVALVTNTQANSISVFDAVAGGTATTSGTSQLPLAVSTDPTRNVAVVASSQAGVFDIFNLSAAGASPSATLRGSINVGGFGGNPLPSSVAFDAATGNFFGSGNLLNQIFLINPDTGGLQTARVGINPTSLAYNYQSSTLVTVNTAGKTISVVDSQTLRTTAVLGIAVAPVACSTAQTANTTCPPPSSVDIHPRTNLAVVADQAGDRILLLPLPR